MKKIPHNSNHSSLIFLLGFLIITFLVGSIYLILMYQNFRLTSDNENTNTKTAVVVEDIDTTNWKPVPYFSSNLNLLFYHPDDWGNSSGVIDNYYIGDKEGPITWLSTQDDLMDYDYYNFSLEKYFDTGDDLDGWVDKKIVEIKSNRGELLDTEDVSYNGIDMRKVCNNGYVAYSPSPVCFVYFQSSPYIIEIEVGSYDFGNYLNIQKYADAFASRIYLLDYKSQGWEKYVSNNMDYEIYYDAEDMPIGSYGGNSYNTFGKEDSNNKIQIGVTTGANNDLEKYWYDEAKYQEGEFPQEIYLDGTRCLLAHLEEDYYNADNDYPKIYCLKNNKLYGISLFENGKDNYFEKMLIMLASFKFTEISKIDTGYIFNNREGKYKIEYPDNFQVYDESGMNRSTVAFNTYYDNYDQIGINISIQKTELSLEECVIDNMCLIYYLSLIDSKDIIFRGINSKEIIIKDDNRLTTNRNIIFKKDGNIYKISITTKDGIDSSNINDMLKSFQFL